MAADDPVKEQQRAAWAHAAAAWRKWAGEHRAATRPVSEAMLEAAGLMPGARVLDVACGVGDPALEAARRVAPLGRVVAIDQSPEMLAMARDLAGSAGLRTIELVLADADAPPPGPFDAVTCRFGLMFFPDPVASVRAWKAVARSGGRIVVAVWTGPEENPMTTVRAEAARKVLDIGLPPAGPNGPALAVPGAVENVLRAAGLREVAARKLTIRWEAPEARTLAEMIVELHPPLAQALRETGADKAHEVVSELTRALEPLADSRGRVSLPGCSWVAAGVA